MKLLDIKGLRMHFITEDGEVPALDGVDLSLSEGETLAVVGESGCGKSVTLLSVLRLIPSPPGKFIGGEIFYNGEDLMKKTEKEMRKIRGNDISMIFQEPMTSLNPVFTVGRQISESLKYHQGMNKPQAREKSIEMLALVGIPTPEKAVDYYPHQMSGGMRQRVMIAMALACNPKILVADEPTTALDVTVQAQIIRLLKDLKEKTKTAIILITHDLGVVAQMAENIMVMYAGQAVEYSGVNAVYVAPLHPYTKGLLKSVPKLTDEQDVLYSIKGAVPSPSNYPKGCRFCPRCDEAMDICREKEPQIVTVADSRKVRCFKYSEGGAVNE